MDADKLIVGIGVLALLAGAAGQEMMHRTDNEGNLRPRISQEQVADWPVPVIRQHGLRIFTTPFNKTDGYGDGPLNWSEDLRLPGGRVTLQDNGTFMRVNGLDAQTCVECHFIQKTSTVPFTFGVGGAAGSNANVIRQPTLIDICEERPGALNGRFINPLTLFGLGGVQLAAREMTADLQELKRQALARPGEVVTLTTKGVNFGKIVADDTGHIDTSDIQGIDADLVVRPFGRKGEFATIREFDLDALRFHFGMEAVEEVGAGFDQDGDGVSDEVTAGEVSALDVFLATRPRPVEFSLTEEGQHGFALFEEIGCTMCHIPSLSTRRRVLALHFPEDWQHVFCEVDLAETAGFAPNYEGGIDVPMFSDLKRHLMGAGLCESFDLVGAEENASFLTAKLWGVRDSAPYLHDGRATTLTEAILALDGEARPARDGFAQLSAAEQQAVLAFLYSLQSPN